MAVATAQVHVHDQNALDTSITSYIAQGYTVQNRGEDFAVLFKKKEFSVLWAIVGLVLCILPLLVYLIVYATQKDQLVEIRIVRHSNEVQWSEDRQHWWDGTAWHHVDAALPPDVQVSPDGQHFWDGASWRAMPKEADRAVLAESVQPAAADADEPPAAPPAPEAGS